MKKLLSLFIALAFLAGITDVALASDTGIVENTKVSVSKTTSTKTTEKKSKSKTAKKSKSKKRRSKFL